MFDTFDIEHVRGDSLGVLLRLWKDDARTQPAVLTNAVVTAQARAAYDAEPGAAFAVAKSGNEVTLAMTPAQTRALPSRGVWDCQVDWQGDGTQVQTVAGGGLHVHADVTRP